MLLSVTKLVHAFRASKQARAQQLKTTDCSLQSVLKLHKARLEALFA